MSGYIQIIEVKDEDKNNKLMSFRINNDELSEKYKTIWTKIKDLKNLELIALPVYDDKYIKSKIRTYVIAFILIFAARMCQKMV